NRARPPWARWRSRSAPPRSRRGPATPASPRRCRWCRGSTTICRRRPPASKPFSERSMSPPNADGGSLAMESARPAPRETSSTLEPAPTILIVDDDPIIRSLMLDALEDQGHAVIEAADGVEALALVEGAAPALIVVDAIMPNMDGFALCRELRRRTATQH